MRKNYNMPESIEECLVTLGVAEVAIDNIKKSIVPDGSSLESTLSDKDFQGSSEFEKLGITIQVDEFEKGNVYVFKTPDGASVSFDERFDTEMLEYYGMPKSVDECLKNIGLSDEEVEICKQQPVFSEKAKPIEEIQKEDEAKVESPTEKKQAVVSKTKADLPFPEVDIEAPKVKTPAIDPQEQIFRNIASQINKVKR